MWVLDHLVLLTVAFASAIIGLAGLGFYLTMTRWTRRARAAHVLNVSTVLAAGAILSVTLNQMWAVRRDADGRIWAARVQHLQRLHALLQAEGAALDDLAHGLRERRYFTLVANDARKAVWHDEVLSPDVVNHFPEYFHEREDLIRGVLDYDTEMGRVRATVSAGLALPEGLEPARSDLVSALVIKCGGADAGSSVARLRSDGVPGSSDAFPVRADAFRGSIAADALEISTDTDASRTSSRHREISSIGLTTSSIRRCSHAIRRGATLKSRCSTARVPTRPRPVHSDRPGVAAVRARP